MSDQHDDGPLLEILGAIQARGGIGDVSLTEAVAFSDQFVAALPSTVARLADLGSGGGLPGLVIAVRRPHMAITLVERRRRRADLLERAVSALRLGDHVHVFAGDVRQLAAESPGSFDAVTARSFAAPNVTARWAGLLLAANGILVVSEPPTASARWPSTILEKAGLVDLGTTRHDAVNATIRCFRRSGTP